MNASELNRKLLYRGYDDMADYLRNSPMNRTIYNLILEYGPEKIESPMLSIFNEIYYQCVRINYDGQPGVELASRYLDEEAEWLGSRESAKLVFGIVWGLLRRKYYPTFHEQCFIEQYYPQMERGEYERLAYILIKISAGKRLLPARKVRTMPSPLGEIKGDKKAWRDITSDFSYKCIENYIKLYPTIKEQRSLLGMIEKACSRKSEKWTFDNLRDSIKAGEYVREQPAPDDPDYNEEADLSYKEELDELKKKYEQQEIKHKREIDSLKWHYGYEIDRLREQLEQNAMNEELKENPGVLLFSFTEMVSVAKERFSKVAADEFSVMLYQLATKHGYLRESISETIDGIVPAVLSRDSLKQSIVIDKPVQQVNINPKEVVNHTKEE